MALGWAPWFRHALPLDERVMPVDLESGERLDLAVGFGKTSFELVERFLLLHGLRTAEHQHADRAIQNDRLFRGTFGHERTRKGEKNTGKLNRGF